MGCCWVLGVAPLLAVECAPLLVAVGVLGVEVLFCAVGAFLAALLAGAFLAVGAFLAGVDEAGAFLGMGLTCVMVFTRSERFP